MGVMRVMLTGMLATARQKMERAFSHPPASTSTSTATSTATTATTATSPASGSSDARRAVSSMDLARVLAPASVPKVVPSAAAADPSKSSAATGAPPQYIPHGIASRDVVFVCSVCCRCPRGRLELC